jgi:uncharacterized lipoprotein
MHKLIASALRATAMIVLISVTACALSPQTVKIVPTLNVQGVTAAAGKRLAVEVRDGRASPVMGYRGGIYETAAIETAPDLTQSITREMERAYSQSGHVIATANDADVRLVIVIERLEYQAQQRNILWSIEFNAAIRATAASGGGEKSLELEDRLTKEFAKWPSEKDNENLVNDVITKLLQRLLENREFLTI